MLYNQTFFGQVHFKQIRRFTYVWARVKDLQQSIDFYMNLLGMTPIALNTKG